MTRYCSKAKTADEVPDPYYGGPAGFDLVLDLLDDAATGLLAHIQQEQQAGLKQ
jgi:protein-tyrosine phosphatase